MKAALVLAFLQLSADGCQQGLVALEPPYETYQVVHVRATRNGVVSYWGYHESGVYPAQVVFDVCEGATLEYRLAHGCTKWNGEGFERLREGRRQKPCQWTDWMPLPLQLIKPAPPELRV